MMDAKQLEVKRKEIELRRVEAARMELEFKIEEKLFEIQRIKDHIQVQIDAEARIKEEIKKIENA